MSGPVEVSEHYIKTHEQNFRDIFSSLNKKVSSVAFVATITVVMALWGSLFGLIYIDIKDMKTAWMKSQLAITRELGEVKTLVAEKTANHR